MLESLLTTHVGRNTNEAIRNFMESDPLMFPGTFQKRQKTLFKKDEKGLHIKFEVPGYEKENLDLSFEEDILTLSGKGNEEEDGFEMVEDFKNSWKIKNSHKYNFSEMHAKLENGILNVTLPYKEGEEKRKIEIK